MNRDHSKIKSVRIVEKVQAEISEVAKKFSTELQSHRKNCSEDDLALLVEVDMALSAIWKTAERAKTQLMPADLSRDEIREVIDATVNEEALRERVIKQERKRCVELNAIARQFGIPLEDLMRAIDQGTSVSDFRASVLDKITTSKPLPIWQEAEHGF